MNRFFVEAVSWHEGGQLCSIRLHVRRWTKHGRDRLYIAEILPNGGHRDLGDFDLVQGRWYTNASLQGFSRQRQDATKAFVMQLVHELGPENA